MHPLEHNDAAYQRGTWELAHVLILVSLPLLLLGLPALHAELRRRGAGAPATAAAVLAVVGFVGMAPGLLVEAYIAPTIGHAAMERLEDGGFGAVGGTMATAWLISLVALFVALRRSSIVGAPARWPFLLAGVVMLGAGGGTSKAAGAAIIAGTAVYGVAIAALGLRLERLSSRR